MKRHLRKLLHFLRRLAPFGAGVLMLALVMRYLWRDEYVWSAPTFYALPLPMHLAGWIFLALLWWRPARRLAWLSVGGALGAAVLWAMNSSRLRGESVAGAGDGPRVLFWNIGHVHSVPGALHELITELKPDMIGLAEAENLGAAGFAELTQQHPGYQAYESDDGVAVMVLGTVTSAVPRRLGWRTAVTVVPAVFSRLPGEWKICLTDIPPLPPLPRTEYLDDIRRAAGEGPRTIIAADFNTPLDASGFDAWRESYHHGFADCADWHGTLETWCYGLPILTIDHIWMSRDYAPRAARKAPRFGQDHSWLFVEWAPAER